MYGKRLFSVKTPPKVLFYGRNLEYVYRYKLYNNLTFEIINQSQ